METYLWISSDIVNMLLLEDKHDQVLLYVIKKKDNQLKQIPEDFFSLGEFCFCPVLWGFGSC